jgi:16S rRNA (guanine1207-N2)-methyltransferase
MELLQLPDRELRLIRLPHLPREPWRAWDAADEYLLAHWRETGETPEAQPLLLVEDHFGALACALHPLRPTLWSDSHIAYLALQHNLAANQLDPAAVRFVPGDREPPGRYARVLLKAPKSLAWLEDLLLRLRPHLLSGAELTLGSMVKHTPARVYRLLERCIGPTRTTRAWRKARLARARFDPTLTLPAALPPTSYELPELQLQLRNRAPLFARTTLDSGTRLLLSHLPPPTSAALSCADLGCGNGILALALARRTPNARIVGVDTSYQAIATARDNATAAGLAPPRVHFQPGEAFTAFPDAHFDLILCNPPFHQGHAVASALARHLIQEAHRTLRPGGELRLVGNRHLGHRAALRRLFGRCQTLAADSRFEVLQVVR